VIESDPIRLSNYQAIIAGITCLSSRSPATAARRGDGQPRARVHALVELAGQDALSAVGQREAILAALARLPAREAVGVMRAPLAEDAHLHVSQEVICANQPIAA